MGNVLKAVVVQRHDEMQSVLVQIEEKEVEQNEEDEQQVTSDDYGTEDDKEKESLDVNKEKVKMIRNNLKENNDEWRELLGNVSVDYQNMTSEKKKLVVGLNESADELKQLLDLVCKIPKRKILDDVNEDRHEEETNAVENNIDDDGKIDEAPEQSGDTDNADAAE